MKQHDYTEEVFATNKDFGDLTAHFDGCAEPVNPNGNMGYGWCIRHKGTLIAQGHGYRLYQDGMFTSNNISEWTACNLALQWIIKNEIKYRSLIVYGDSKMVIMQANGEWNINPGKGYSPMAFMYKEKFEPYLSNTSFKWIPRDENTYCDKLSKLYIEVTGTKLNEGDFGRKRQTKKEKPLKFTKPKKVPVFNHIWDIKSAKFYQTITCIKCGCTREYIKERFSDGYQLYTINGEETLKNPNCIK